MGQQIKYLFITALLILIQTQAMRLLSLEGMTPDILTIWVVYIAIRHGHPTGTIWGFIIGLAFDLVTGNFIGLSALTKTICGFIAGYFYNENKEVIILRSYRFIVIVLSVSFIQNVVYFLIFTQGTSIGMTRAIFEFGLVTTLYTAIISLIPMFIFSRKTSR